MNGSDSHTQPDNPEYHFLPTNQSSPSGKFVRAFHLVSSQTRVLKILRADLARNQAFLGWYTSAVTLSGRAGKVLRIAGLIPPKEFSENRWIDVRDGEYVVERQYFGEDEDPEERADNLAQFVATYGERDHGIEEKAALAIMSLVTSTLKTMHKTHLGVPGGIVLQGIPHLNLKPENVLIGRDKFTKDIQVRLTDFLVPLGIPLADEAGIRNVFNYASPEILQDNGFLGLRADIYSCGLLLYRLLENKDLIRHDLSRKTVLDEIRDSLPRQVKELKLSDASSKSRAIIQRCLTEDRDQRFPNMEALKARIDEAMEGADPVTVLDALVRKPKRTQADIEKEQARLETQRKRRRELRTKATKYGAMAIGAIAILLVAYFGISAIKRAIAKSGYETAKAEFDRSWTQVRQSGCLPKPEADQITQNSRLAEQLASTEKYGDAETALKSLSSELTAIDSMCQEFARLTREGGEAPGNPSVYPQYDKFAGQWETELNSAQAAFGRRNLSEARVSLSAARSYLDQMKTPLPWCNWDSVSMELNGYLAKVQEQRRDQGRIELDRAQSACVSQNRDGFDEAKDNLIALTRLPADTTITATPPPSPCRSELAGLRTQRDALKSTPCEIRANEMYNQARQACNSNDTALFESLRQQLLALVGDPSCQQPPPPTNKCDSARILYQEVAAKMSDFEQNCRTQGVDFAANQSYLTARESLDKAKLWLDSAAVDPSNCTKIIWHAKNARTNMPPPCPEPVDKCPSLKARLSVVRNLVRTDPAVMRKCSTLYDYVEWYVKSGKCADAKKALDDFDNCVTPGRVRKDTGKAPAITPVQRQFTYAECRSLYNRGRYDSAWKVCENVPPSDPQHKDAMKLTVLAAGRDPQFRVDMRKRIQQAYRNSSIDLQITEDNCEAWVSMTCLYGWDRNNLSVDSALMYYERAKACGIGVTRVGSWWKAKLIAARCYYTKWCRRTADLQARRTAKNEVQEAAALILGMADKPPGYRMYVDELERYVTNISANKCPNP